MKGSKNQDTGNSAGERHPEAAYSDPRRAGEARFVQSYQEELPCLLGFPRREEVGRKEPVILQGAGQAAQQQEGPWEGG